MPVTTTLPRGSILYLDETSLHRLACALLSGQCLVQKVQLIGGRLGHPGRQTVNEEGITDVSGNGMIFMTHLRAQSHI